MSFITTYVALLRGITPSNPSMQSARLQECFEALRFQNVRTVIGSGNVVFASTSQDSAGLEAKIEKGLLKILGFKSTTSVRSHAQIEALVRRNPFRGVKDEKPNYLLVTFFKDGRPEVASAFDTSAIDGTKIMSGLQKQYGKEITTRTWKTVHRILAKMTT